MPAEFRIDQATPGAGTAGRSRHDLVPGEVITLTATSPAPGAGVTFSWEILDKRGSVATLSASSGTSVTVGLADAIASPCSFLIEMTANDNGVITRTRRIASVRTTNTGLRVPVFPETAPDGNKLALNDPNLSTDNANYSNRSGLGSSQNWAGWAEWAWELVNAVESLGGGAVDLQTAFDGGNIIDTAGQGPVEITTTSAFVPGITLDEPGGAKLYLTPSGVGADSDLAIAPNQPAPDIDGRTITVTGGASGVVGAGAPQGGHAILDGGVGASGVNGNAIVGKDNAEETLIGRSDLTKPTTVRGSTVTVETASGLAITGNATVSGGLAVGGSAIRARPSIQTDGGASVTLSDSHNDTIRRMTSAAAVTVTVPTGLTAGTTVEFVQEGAGQITVVGDVGMTLRHAAAFTPATAEQWSSLVVTILDTDEALVRGDLAAA